MQEKFMKIALKLAEKGKGFVSPNPLVGAVLVKQGKIIAKGYHKKFGTAHAEIVALNKAGKKAKNSELYVNLEPCSHFGKTPPCTTAIINAGIKKVFIGMKDPNKKVNGKGIRKLRNAGIKVELATGEIKKQSQKLNKFYIKWISLNQPFVLQKIALTQDGFISWGNGKNKKITSKKSNKFVHQLRNDFDGILIGIGTVKKDNPKLTSRIKNGRNPVRIILDSKLEISLKANVLKKGVNRIIFCSHKANKKKKEKLEKLGVEVIEINSKKELLDLKQVFQKLGEKNIASILIEGGQKLNSSLIKEKLADEILLIISPKKIKKGLFFVDNTVKKFELKNVSTTVEI